jgi:16S rRNA (cytosine967-C5)-methyltransferase
MHVTGVLMSKISPSRAIAFQVLRAVAEGAYASDLLRDRRRSLEARDAALASQIVFGCLRYQGQLDYLISLYSGKPNERLDLDVLVALRAAIFQLRYLERVPVHAAVHESVEYVKRSKRAATGFVNAVLRKANRDPVEWPNEATELSCPAWLLNQWCGHFGPEQTRGIARTALAEPTAYIRIRPGDHLPAGIEAEPTDVEGCWRLLSAPSPGMRLHDISSQAIVPLLNLQPGHTYLDLCSAPGNKTLQALETPLALALACDVSGRRLRDVPPVCPRIVLDGTRPLPFSRKFDRIFIDAPCSGTGTLARNPEIKWRLRAGDLAGFREKQMQMVAHALPHLAPGGKLLYATCSLELEENEEVVRGSLASDRDLRLERDMWRIPGREEGDGFYAAVITRA